MVAQIVDQIGQAAQSAAAQEQSPSKSKEVGEVGPVDERMQVVNASEVAPDTPAAALDSGAPVQSNNDVIAPQHDLEEGERAPEQVTRRIHGGALPR
jgi:hypothetical protein